MKNPNPNSSDRASNCYDFLFFACLRCTRLILFIVPDQMFLFIEKSFESCHILVAVYLLMQHWGKNRSSRADSCQDINVRLTSKQFGRRRFSSLRHSGPRCYFVNLRQSFVPLPPNDFKTPAACEAVHLEITQFDCGEIGRAPCCVTHRVSSSTAWITCTAAANPISSECRLTLPRSLTYSAGISVFFTTTLCYSLSSPTEPPPHPESHTHPTPGPEQAGDQKY